MFLIPNSASFSNYGLKITLFCLEATVKTTLLQKGGYAICRPKLRSFLSADLTELLCNLNL